MSSSSFLLPVLPSFPTRRSSDLSQFRLLRERRFAPFFWTQFLGAGNDNIYKNALVIFVAFQAATLTTLSANEDRKSTRLNSSHRCISYAVFSLQKKNCHHRRQTT